MPAKAPRIQVQSQAVECVANVVRTCVAGLAAEIAVVLGVGGFGPVPGAELALATHHGGELALLDACLLLPQKRGIRTL